MQFVPKAQFESVVAEEEVKIQKARHLKTLTPRLHSFMNILYLEQHPVRGKPKNTSCTDAVYMRMPAFATDVNKQASVAVVQVPRSFVKALNHETGHKYTKPFYLL